MITNKQKFFFNKERSRLLNEQNKLSSDYFNFLYNCGYDLSSDRLIKNTNEAYIKFSIKKNDHVIKHRRVWKTIRNYPYYRQSLITSHFTRTIFNCPIGFPIHKNSTSVIFDLDNKELTEKDKLEHDMINKEIINYIVSIFYSPTLAERSTSSKSCGYHLLYCFSNYIPENILNNVKASIKKKFNVDIEIYSRFNKRPFRGFYSKTYRDNCGVYDSSQKDLIRTLNFKTIQEKVNPFFSERRSWKTDKTFQFSNLSILNSINDNINSLEETELKVKDRINHLSSDYFTNGESKRYGNGNRVYTLTRLSLISKTFDDFKEKALRYHDGTSKDIGDNGQSWLLEEELPKIWRWAEKKQNFKQNTRAEAYSFKHLSINYLDETESNFYKLQFSSLILSKGKGINKEKQVKNLLKTYNLLISNKEFFEKNPLNYNSISKRFKPLEEGMLFNQDFRKKIAKIFNIQNIEYCYKFLLKHNFIQPILLDSKNPKTNLLKKVSYCPPKNIVNNAYAIGFSKHFIVIDYFKDILRLVYKILTKIKINIDSEDLFKIYYMLIRFFRYFDKELNFSP